MCGRIQAYQVGSTDAFHASVSARRTSMDSAYVDGVSVAWYLTYAHVLDIGTFIVTSLPNYVFIENAYYWEVVVV